MASPLAPCAGAIPEIQRILHRRASLGDADPLHRFTHEHGKFQRLDPCVQGGLHRDLLAVACLVGPIGNAKLDVINAWARKVMVHRAAMGRFTVADAIRRRRVTTIPRCRLDAEFAGATYVAEPLVVDGNLYFCRYKRECALWMKAYAEALAT